MSKSIKTRITAVCVCISLVFNNPVLANPLGGSVVGGNANATVAGQGTAVTTINQNANNVIINWQSFSIGHGEVTRFVQPSATASALNRVITGSPTAIYGSLQANGRVIVVNPNGIVVGASGQIDTKSFVASTLNVSDASFMSGRNLVFSGSSSAGIRNDGAIRALGGDVYLIAHTVENAGSIRAAGGTVGLAAGSEVRLVQSGNERISVVAGNSSAPTAAGVVNSGSIEAASAELKAAGGNIYALAINNGGVVRATGIASRNGHVYLTTAGGNIENSGTIAANNVDGSGGTIVMSGGHNAGNAATVTSSGTISARGDAAGTKGGTVEMLGDHVGLFGNALVDVSGNAGGGTALIGGDAHGANAAIQNAEATYVGPNAQIKADAIATGNGGKVVVWADDTTQYYGNIFARGGALGGNGGFAEVSGKNNLLFRGHADLSAPAGLLGTLLLDPDDITITDTADGTGTLDDELTPNSDANLPFNVPNDGANTVSRGQLEAFGANADIVLAAANNITINDISLANGNHLNLAAGNGGSITFTADADNDNAGSFSMNAGDTIQTQGGAVHITGVGITIGSINTSPAGNADPPLDGGAVTAISHGNGNISVSGSILTQGGAATPGANNTGAAGGNVTLTAAGVGTLSIHAINTTGGGAAITGGANRNGGVGGAVDLTGASITLNGDITANGGAGAGTTGNVGARGNVDFNSPVIVAGDTSVSGGTVHFFSTINGLADGVADLSVNGNSPTAPTFDNTIGITTPLDSFSVQTSVTMNFLRDVKANSVSLWADNNGNGTGDTLTFGAGVTISANSQTYQAGDGPAGSGGTSVNLRNNTPAFENKAGTATPNSFTYQQDGAIADTDIPLITQFFGSIAPLAYRIQSDEGSITLATAANVADSALTLVADTTLAINTSLSLASLDATAAGGITITVVPGAAVQTTGNQTYHSALTLAGGLTGARTFTSTSSGTIRFQGTVDANAAGIQGLTAATDGTTEFDAAVGATTALGALIIRGNSVASAGSANLNGPSIRTSSGQTYENAVTLNSDNALRDTGGQNIVFNSTLNGAHILQASTSGDEIFNGVVGGATALTSLSTDIIGTVGGNTRFNMTAPGGVLRPAGVNAGSVTLNDTAVMNVAAASGAAPSVQTSGGQTYAGAVTLSRTTVLKDTGSQNITFSSTVNGAQSLEVDTGGNEIFNGVVGGATPLTGLTTDAGGGAAGQAQFNMTAPGGLNPAGVNVGSLFVNDGASLNVAGSSGAAPSVRSSSGQVYNGAVVLNANAVLTDVGGNNIVFFNTVNAASAGGQSLTTATDGGSQFSAAVGTTALSSLTTGGQSAVNSGATFLFGPIVTTTGNQNYQNPVVQFGNVHVTGSSLTLGSTWNANNNNLQLTLASLVTIPGNFLNIINFISDGAGGTLINADFTTTGSQTYGNAVTLGGGPGTRVLTSTAGGNIQFQNTVNDSAPGVQGLSVRTDGTTEFDGAVGAVNVLASLNIFGFTSAGAGNANLNGTSIRTTGGQTYQNAVNLSGNTVLSDIGSFDINFNSTINGAHTLQVDTAGNEFFFGAVGGATPLTSLTTDGAGTVGGFTVFNMGAPGGAHPAGVNAGSVTVNDTAFFAVGGVSATAPSVQTSGGQTYNGAVSLSQNTLLRDTASANITFNSTVDGNRTLEVDTAGNEIFNGVVGGVTALVSLITDAGGGAAGQAQFNMTAPGGGLPAGVNAGSVTINDTAVMNVSGSTAVAPSVQTSGGQTYNGAVTLSQDTVLKDTGNQNITLGSTVNGAHILEVDTGGNEFFNGVVGGATALLSLITDASGVVGGQAQFNMTAPGGGARPAGVNAGTVTINDSALLNVASSTTVAPSVQTSGGQNYNSTVNLGQNTVLKDTGNQNITFASLVDGLRALEVDTGGNEIFNGVVGGVVALLSLTTDAGGGAAGQAQFNMTAPGFFNPAGVNAGSVTINDTAVMNVSGSAFGTPSVQTSGGQTYNGAVSLSQNTVLKDTASQNITFAAVDGARTLEVDTAGNTAFNGVVGGTTPLTSLTTDAAGQTAILGGRINANNQDYKDAVTLGANTELAVDNANNPANSVNFESTVDGNFTLTVDAMTTIFGGAVGAITPLAALVTDIFGTTSINGGRVNANNQDYKDAVLLGSNTELALDNANGSANSVNFESVVNGNVVLIVDALSTTFGGVVGNVIPLFSLITDAAGTTTINGGRIGAFNQDYQDAVVLGADTVLAGDSFNNPANTINLRQTVNADLAANNRTLTVIAFSDKTFGGAVGGNQALALLDIQGGGPTHINGDFTARSISIAAGGDFTGNRTLKADDMNIGGNITGSSRLTLLPLTDGRAISLGVETPGALSLTAFELANFVLNIGGVLQIGDLNSGDMTISGGGTITFNTPILSLRSGGSILESASTSITVAAMNIVTKAPPSAEAEPLVEDAGHPGDGITVRFLGQNHVAQLSAEGQPIEFFSAIEDIDTTTQVDGIGDISTIGRVPVNSKLVPPSGAKFALSTAALAALASAVIPAPRLDTANFSGSSISTDQAALILPAGAIGTLWLQLPFAPTEDRHYKVEDASKWTSGRISAVGSTAGPQSAK